jgi:hypothetical protein
MSETLPYSLCLFREPMSLRVLSVVLTFTAQALPGTI